MVKKILKTKKQIKKYKGGAGIVLQTCRTFTEYIKNFKNFKNITEALEKELEKLITKESGEIIINSINSNLNIQLPKPKTLSVSGIIKSIIKKSITELLNKPSNNKTINIGFYKDFELFYQFQIVQDH